MTLASACERIPRRQFIRLAAGAAAVGPLSLWSRGARARQPKLRILKWAHFVPQYDVWFENTARDWGQRHQTRVTVDRVPVEEIRAAAMAEVRAAAATEARAAAVTEAHGGGDDDKSHDICIFPWSPAEFGQYVIDHTEIYQRVASAYGSIPQLAHRSTFDPRGKRYFAFADFWMPSPLHFYQDCWAEVGMPLGPVHYGSLRVGGRKLREKSGIPCGLAFTPTLEGNVTLHTMLYAFRAWILDSSGNVLFNKNGFAQGALNYLQTLYRESGSAEQLEWGPAGNVQAMLARKTAVTSNAISLLRAAEKENPKAAGRMLLQPPLLGRNGMGVTALPHVTNCSVIWRFARNPQGARQFLADLVQGSKSGYEQSLGCNFPIYPKTVPDLIVRLSRDARADPPYKYVELKDALHWTPNLGVPGFATPAYMEVFNSSVVPRMVASVLKGERSVADAAAAGAAEIERTVAKWQRQA